MTIREIVGPAIDQLCAAFERGGYNPTPIIDLGVLMVNADGVITDKEREVLLDVFQTLLDTKLSPEVVNHLVTASVDVMKAAGESSRTRLLAEILLDVDAVEPGVLVALAVAYSSEGFDKDERAAIERLADAARLPRARLEELIKRVADRAEGDPVSVRSMLATAPKV